VSIADLVADYHAHTPTEAAQVATAAWKQVRELVDTAGIRLRREMRTIFFDARQRLTAVERHEVFRRPKDRIAALGQLVDDRQRSLTLAVATRLRTATAKLTKFDTLLLRCHPRHVVSMHRQRISTLADRAHTAAVAQVRRLRLRIDGMDAQLRALSPERVLQRGYSITTRKKDGLIIRSIEQIKPGDRLVTRLADGTIESIAQDQRQMNLFE